MNTSHARQVFPKAALYGAAGLILVSLMVAGAARLTDDGTVAMPDGTVTQTRALRFEDRKDGGVTILDASNGAVVEVVAPGTNGFIRGALRGLNRERLRRDIGAEPPFTLTLFEDGRLLLIDPTTNRSIDLGAFGRTQTETFVRLLTAKEGQS